MSELASAVNEGAAPLSAASEMDGKYLTFWTDGQLFGMPIRDVLQIIGMQEVTGVPEFPSYAKGIINLRGDVVPIIDVRLRLGKPEIGYTERTCIIVTNVNGRSTGCIVDGVNEVTAIGPEEICDPPEVDRAGLSFLTGVVKREDKVILLVDTQRILGDM